MSAEELEKIASLAEAGARRYKRLCWWADEDELRQEAWVAMLAARKTWLPGWAPLGAYLWAAVVRRLADHLWQQSAPVGAPRGRGRAALAGKTRAPLDPRAACDAPPADVVLGHAEWTARLRGELLAVAMAAGAPGHFERAMTEEDAAVPAELAYEDQSRFMKTARCDAALWRLWKEMGE